MEFILIKTKNFDKKKKTLKKTLTKKHFSRVLPTLIKANDIFKRSQPESFDVQGHGLDIKGQWSINGHKGQWSMATPVV